MKFKPKKVGERRDAARYVIGVVVNNILGGEDEVVVGPNVARQILAQLNNTDLEAAQKLLDMANIEYERAERTNYDVDGAEMQFGSLGEEYQPDALRGDTWIDEE